MGWRKKKRTTPSDGGEANRNREARDSGRRRGNGQRPSSGKAKRVTKSPRKSRSAAKRVAKSPRKTRSAEKTKQSSAASVAPEREITATLRKLSSLVERSLTILLGIDERDFERACFFNIQSGVQESLRLCTSDFLNFLSPRPEVGDPQHIMQDIAAVDDELLANVWRAIDAVKNRHAPPREPKLRRIPKVTLDEFFYDKKILKKASEAHPDFYRYLNLKNAQNPFVDRLEDFCAVLSDVIARDSHQHKGAYSPKLVSGKSINVVPCDSPEARSVVEHLEKMGHFVMSVRYSEMQWFCPQIESVDFVIKGKIHRVTVDESGEMPLFYPLFVNPNLVKLCLGETRTITLLFQQQFGIFLVNTLSLVPYLKPNPGELILFEYHPSENASIRRGFPIDAKCEDHFKHTWDPRTYLLDTRDKFLLRIERRRDLVGTWNEMVGRIFEEIDALVLSKKNAQVLRDLVLESLISTREKIAIDNNRWLLSVLSDEAMIKVVGLVLETLVQNYFKVLQDNREKSPEQLVSILITKDNLDLIRVFSEEQFGGYPIWTSNLHVVMANLVADLKKEIPRINVGYKKFLLGPEKHPKSPTVHVPTADQELGALFGDELRLSSVPKVEEGGKATMGKIIMDQSSIDLITRDYRKDSLPAAGGADGAEGHVEKGEEFYVKQMRILGWIPEE